MRNHKAWSLCTIVFCVIYFSNFDLDSNQKQFQFPGEEECFCVNVLPEESQRCDNLGEQYHLQRRLLITDMGKYGTDSC